MSGDTRKRPIAGQTFEPSASQQSWIISSIEQLLANQRVGQTQTPNTGDCGTVMVRNISTTTDLKRFSIARITGINVAPGTAGTSLAQFQQQPIFNVDVPNDTTEQAIVVVQTPLPKSASGKTAIGRARIDGVAEIKISSATAANPKYCRPKNNETEYMEGEGGPFRILYRESGTGEKWGAIKLPCEITGVLCKTIGNHAQGATQDVAIHRGATKGSETDTTERVPAYNRGEDITGGTWCLMIWVGGKPEITPLTC